MYNMRTSQMISTLNIELAIGIPVNKATDGELVNLYPNNSTVTVKGQEWLWVPVIAATD
jgi:hypothetical protein